MLGTFEPAQRATAPHDTHPASCRQCGEAAPQDLGPIPKATVFAGQPLQPPWYGGSLYRCRRCHLVFRHPIRTDDEYEGLYAQASGEIWVSNGLRVDQRRVLDCIEAEPGSGTVLDVGCYDGSLLAALPARFRRYGIEASTAAAAKARERGIEIVASRIGDLPSVRESFDVICAVDVIEHVSQPRDFLAKLARRLTPRGRLLISTGNADAEPWRAAGGLYWYCSFPEHISFISPAWATNVAAELGLRVSAAEPFAYGELDAATSAKQGRRYRRKLARARLRSLLRHWLWPIPPTTAGGSVGLPGLFEDHVLLCFEPAA